MSGEGQADTRADEELLRNVLEAFRNDVRMFWEHSTFYAVVQGALLTVYAAVTGGAAADPATGVVVSVGGLLLSGFWALAARGRMRLIDDWRDLLVATDRRLEQAGRGRGELARFETRVRGLGWRDPTRLTSWLPAVLALAWWVLLVVRDLPLLVTTLS